ncbi:integrase [Nocardia sp. NPDC050793]|uniref:integrase n=1 Tax=Nocardia sp. NPDC050793 TaxID=3155159 RepID=UPI0033EB94B8
MNAGTALELLGAEDGGFAVADWARVAALVAPGSPAGEGVDAADWAAVVAAVSAAQAPNTVRAYVSDWQRFERFCGARGFAALPVDPAHLAVYLAVTAATRTESGQRAYALATLRRWVAAINRRHAEAGHPHPGSALLIRRTITGIEAEYAAEGARPPRRAAPLVLEDMLAIITHLHTSPGTWHARVPARRDAALLLLGYAGAFRRSELADLRVSDVRRRRHGLDVRLRQSKTSRTAPLVRPLPHGSSPLTCPPCAHLRWLRVLAAHQDGGRPAIIRLLREPDPAVEHVCGGRWPVFEDREVPLFRWVRGTGLLAHTHLSGDAINLMVRRRAAEAGLVADIGVYGGHSARAGHVTEGFRRGLDANTIMRGTGHKNPRTLEVYRREADPLAGNSVTRIGL